MGGPVKKIKVSPLNLHRVIPVRDVRKLIWKYIGSQDRQVVQVTQNSNKKPNLELSFSYYCVKNGHLSLLKWARENGSVGISGCYWNEWTCAGAAAYGHLEVLKWARENGCDWNSDTCSFAAWNDHLEVLQWARENGCPK